MKTSVLIPAYNEVRYLAEVLRQVSAVPIEKEIIVVDDGSTDGTWELLQQADFPDLRAFRHERNSGKGAALLTALEKASGDIILIQDADLEYLPAEYPLLLKPILEDGAQVVYGSRILANMPKSYLRYFWGGRFLTYLTNFLYGTSITDEPTCYKVFRKEVLARFPLGCQHFEFCPEVTGKIARLGIPIHEVPITYRPRKIHEGKKIRWWDGVQAIYVLLYYRLVPPSVWAFLEDEKSSETSDSLQERARTPIIK